MSIAPHILNKLSENDLKLTEVSLSTNQLSDDDIKTLCKAIDGNTALKNLELGNAKISAIGAKYIGNLLKKTNAIETLYLRGNEIGDEGAVYLADALASNNCLKHLYLGGNQIKLAGVSALAESLSINDSLESIYLRNNFVGNEGAKIIADNLINNFSLKIINLANSSITDIACLELAKIFDLNLTIKEIIYEHNEIADSQTIQNLEEKIKYNNSDGVALATMVAKKIFNFCLNIIESDDENIKANNNSQLSLDNNILTRSEQYNCFGNHNLGNSIICFGFLFRMISQAKYQNISDSLIKIIHNNFAKFTEKLTADLKNEKVIKPNSQIISFAKNWISDIPN